MVRIMRTREYDADKAQSLWMDEAEFKGELNTRGGGPGQGLRCDRTNPSGELVNKRQDGRRLRDRLERWLLVEGD
jgi:hypothetical protein